MLPYGPMVVDSNSSASGISLCSGQASIVTPLALDSQPSNAANPLAIPSFTASSAITASSASISTEPTVQAAVVPGFTVPGASVPTEPTVQAVIADMPPLDLAAAPPPRQRKVQTDFNADGQTDLVWRNYATGENMLWLMNGITRVSTVALEPLNDLNWRIEGVNDFTGDGKADILWRNYATGENMVWVMNGTAKTAVLPLPVFTDRNWQIQGTADFTGDGKADLLWRNYATGEDVVWSLTGTTLNNVISLPTVAGVNLKIQAIADFNRDGTPDIVWRNELSGENFVWSMQGTTVAGTTFLPTAPDLNWQIRGTGDFNGDGKIDLLWRNSATGENFAWVLDGLAYADQTIALPTLSDPNWQIGLQDTLAVPSLVKLSDRTFSGKEGDAGTFTVQLTQAPTANVTLTFTTGDFTVVDSDATIANGTQNTITFTPDDWNQARTVSFIAEDDRSSDDRLLGNTVSYALSGGFTGNAVYELGDVTNTYAPDPNHFNIDLDFRNDSVGFWTPLHRAIAQKAAADWASRIASEWTDFQLDGSAIGRLESYSGRPYSFVSKRAVDDLLIFVNPYQSSSSNEPSLGGPDYQFGGWITSPDLMPRVGQVAINPNTFSGTNDPSGWLLYQAVTHEIGHVLGLVGLNWIGYNLEDRTTPQTAVFKGEYARAANGGNYVALQSQDGASPVTGTYDYSHPANAVNSIMSYSGIYNLYAPTNVDYAMLADSGYRVYGFNA